MIYNPVK